MDTTSTGRPPDDWPLPGEVGLPPGLTECPIDESTAQSVEPVQTYAWNPQSVEAPIFVGSMTDTRWEQAQTAALIADAANEAWWQGFWRGFVTSAAVSASWWIIAMLVGVI